MCLEKENCFAYEPCVIMKSNFILLLLSHVLGVLVESIKLHCTETQHIQWHKTSMANKHLWLLHILLCKIMFTNEHLLYDFWSPNATAISKPPPRHYQVVVSMMKFCSLIQALVSSCLFEPAFTSVVFTDVFYVAEQNVTSLKLVFITDLI